MLRGNNFHHMVSIGSAIAPQSVTNTSVNGNSIVEPWKTARQLAFIIMGGAFAASVDGSFTIQGLRRDDGSTWETLQDYDDPRQNLILSGAAYDDGGSLENGVLLASMDVSRIDSDTYEAVRLVYTEGGNAAALIAVSYVLYDHYDRPSGQEDETFSRLQGGQQSRLQ